MSAGWMRRRGVVLAAAVCVGFGVGALSAVQASASGSGGGSAAVTPNATATNVHCGQVLTASVTLNGDLDCGESGAGLLITGNSVNLNLGGHILSGPGTTGGLSGVEVRGTSDTVQNGVITNFDVGVLINGSHTATILNVRAVGNGYGFKDAGTGTKITTSTAARNLNYGIWARGWGPTTYSGDKEVSNGSTGIHIAGADLLVTGNTANGNQTGIADHGSHTTLTKNIANFNAHDGISIAFDVAVVDGGGNTAKGNDYATGEVPEQCNGVICT